MATSIDEPFPGVLLLLSNIIAGTPLFYSLNGLFLVLLLFASAMISGSEVAFFSLSSDDISKSKTSDNYNDKVMLGLLNHPKRLLATILIINNLVNIAIVTLSTFISWEIAGTKSPQGTLIVALTFSVTFAIVFFGEVLPKVYATQNNLNFARSISPVIKFASTIVRPLAVVLMSLSNVIEKRVAKKDYYISVDELNQALEITSDNDTTEEEKGILKGIVNFGTLSVTQVMRSRLDITAFDIEDDFHELIDQINKSGYSRIPVYRDTIDKIEGILYIKDLLPYLDKEEKFEWQRLLRPGFFIPESKKVDALLRDFQEKRVHMAIVVDEYGGTSGLITLEDVIEEIVGEINDEFDDDDIAYNKLDDNTYVFEGKTSLNDFCKIINVDPNVFEVVKGESESLGGLLLEIYAKMPRVGEKVSFDRFVFTVVSVDSKRIKRVRVLIKDIAKNDANIDR